MVLSVGGQPVSRTPRPADELLFGSVDGVVVLRRQGSKWDVERRELEGLHVSSLAMDPRSGAIFAGTHNGGVHVSRDDGRTWQRCDQGFLDEQVYSVGVAEANGETRVYAGTEPAALYVSTDLGQTWTELPGIRNLPGQEHWTFPAPPHIAHVKHITFDPRSADVVYVSIEQGTLAKTADGGKTWRIIFDHPGTDVHRVSVPPTRPDWVYMTRGDFSIGKEGIYLTRDDGQTWDRLTDRSLGIGYPDATVLHPDDANLMLYAGGVASPREWRQSGDASTQVARTRDGGKSWEILPSVPPAETRGNIEAMAMNVWPDGFAVCGGTTIGEIFRTEDAGDSWTTIATGLPAISKGGHWRAFLRAPGDPVGAGAH
jgi:photosystem II stability/assembly factor-like uncharacterized protein